MGRSMALKTCRSIIYWVFSGNRNYTLPKYLDRNYTTQFWDLSRERESSEQFVWLNRRYGETETQLSRSAITPSIRADASQNEMI